MKIMSIREWFDFEEAAEYLTNALEETVTKDDVHSLIVQKSLPLSVRISNRYQLSRICQLHKNLPDGKVVWEKGMEMWRPYERGYGYFEMSKEVLSLNSGVYDLPRTGYTLDIIEDIEKTGMFNDFPDVPFEDVYLTSPSGIFWILVKREVDTHEDDPNGPAKYTTCGMPHNSKLVIRGIYLRDFADKLLAGSATKEKPLGTRERNSILRTIGGLLLVLESKGLSEAEAIRWLADNSYADLEGLSKSTLEARFSEAKKMLNN